MLLLLFFLDKIDLWYSEITSNRLNDITSNKSDIKCSHILSDNAERWIPLTDKTTKTSFWKDIGFVQLKNSISLKLQIGRFPSWSKYDKTLREWFSNFQKRICAVKHKSHCRHFANNNNATKCYQTLSIWYRSMNQICTVSSNLNKNC